MFMYQKEILIKYQTYPFPLKCLPSTKSLSLIFCNKLKLRGGVVFSTCTTPQWHPNLVGSKIVA